MTYIEFFDEVALNNVHTILSYVPDRVIIIGYHKGLMEKHKEHYQKVLKARDYDVEFIPRKVRKNNLKSAVDVISDIVENNADCVFDVTGGDELLLLALGMVWARTDKPIQIQKFNLVHNKVYDCDEDGEVVYRDAPMLSVEENVQIYGGGVVTDPANGQYTYPWDLTDEFLQDIEDMWAICSRDVKQWNRQINVFAEMNKPHEKEEGLLTLSMPLPDLEKTLKKVNDEDERKRKNRDEDAPQNRIIRDQSIITDLLEKGLLTCFVQYGNDLVVSFKNEQVKKCLTKEGQALEMKVYVTAKFLQDENGDPVYNDVMNGVFIDWDGECHDERTEGKYDVENEIDVMMMHGVIPIFVSCKNGKVPQEEVYKLNTVAAQFGGPYAKKVLIAPALGQRMRERERKNIRYLDSEDMSHNYLRQRAQDMQILLIEDVDDSLPQLLAEIWSK